MALLGLSLCHSPCESWIYVLPDRVTRCPGVCHTLFWVFL